MPKFRKRPVVIEAEQFVPPLIWPAPVLVGDEGDYFVDTLEGRMRCQPNDWIITGIAGEHYACKPEIFEATYEPVEDDT
jgi:hypothetical protein